MPNLGGVKLWNKLNSSGVPVGRDGLYRLLRAHDLMVKHEKRRVVTTDSRAWYRQFPNLVKGLEITRPNQVWVSDITYVDTIAGFVYLSLVTDAYSRRIMGWYVHRHVKHGRSVERLVQGVRAGQGKRDQARYITRTGVCNTVVTCTPRWDFEAENTSMTQDGSPYDNAIAERVNGILKREWLNGGLREHRTGVGEGGENRRVIQRAETALLYRAEHA